LLFVKHLIFICDIYHVSLRYYKLHGDPEGETALYETVIFSKVYERYGRLLFDQRPLLVYGIVAEDNGAVSVKVE
jgi:hypothetical protein